MSRDTTGLFQLAYAIVGAGAGAMLAVLIITANPHAAIQRDYGTRLKPITNKTYPNQIEKHFKTGGEYSQASAQGIGMKNGTCYVYTNEVSWLAMECFGTVK